MNNTMKYIIVKPTNSSFEKFLNDLMVSRNTRNVFINTIISTGFENCYLEFPVLCPETKNNAAEYTVIEAKSFARADWHVFEDKFKTSNKNKQMVVVFPNLSNDALLCVPAPIGKTDKWSGHLMDFFKHGPEDQKHELIETFARTALTASYRYVYISTHGHGVPWLHIRISKTPRYYTHQPYIDTIIT
jgi:hypothetical protein